MPNAARPAARTCLSLLVLLVAVDARQLSGQQERDTPSPADISPEHDGSGDFDWEIGDWTAHISRLVEPLSGSSEWVEYDGTSIVRPVWDGKANLGELDVEGSAGRIQGLSLRLYNPDTRQWYISWASSRDGALGPPMIGGFSNGIGEFYNQEFFNGRPVFVRFIFSDITPMTFRLEQAFSDDGGKTWEPNWIATFERQQ